MGFLKGIISEIDKIIWPDRETVLFYFVAVFFVTALLTLYIYGLDELFVYLIDFII